MDLEVIRKKTEQLYQKNYQLLIPSFYLINCVNLLVQILSSGTVAMIVGLLTAPLVQGFIHMSLMLIHQEVDDFGLKDIFIGIFQFAKYFPSYVVRNIIIVLTSLFSTLPAFVLIYMQNTDQMYHTFDSFLYLIFTSGLNFERINDVLQACNSPLTFIFFLVGLFVYAHLTIIFIFVPCIVEDYDYAWNEALVQSVKMMKGHVKEFIYFWISLLPNYLVYLLFSLLAMLVCQWIPVFGSSIYLVISLLGLISIYQIRFYQGVALFYIEVRDEIKNPHELFRI